MALSTHLTGAELSASLVRVAAWCVCSAVSSVACVGASHQATD